MIMQVLSPSTSLWDQQTLFVVQPPGVRPAVGRWSPLTDEGWTLVFPRWETPADLRGQIEDCRKRGLDRSRFVIVGLSDAGPLAVRLAQEVGVPCVQASGEDAPDVIAQRALKTIPPAYG